MNVRISDGQYGFGKIWVLECYGKSFYLGQDSKVCSRMLDMSPAQVVQAIGTNRLDTEQGRQKLAKFIVKKIGITRSNVNKFQSWQFSAE